MNRIKDIMIKYIRIIIVLLFVFSWIVLIFFSHCNNSLFLNLNAKILTEDLPVGIIISSIFYFISYEIPSRIEQHKYNKFLNLYFANIYNNYYIIFSFIVKLLKCFHNGNDVDFDVMKLEKRDFMFLDGKRDEDKKYYNKKIGYFVQSQNKVRIQHINTLYEIVKSCSKDIIDATQKIKEYSCNGLKLDFDRILIIKEIDESHLIRLGGQLQRYDIVSNVLHASYSIFKKINWLDKNNIVSIEYMTDNDLFQQQNYSTPKVLENILINIPTSRSQHKTVIINEKSYISKLISNEIMNYYINIYHDSFNDVVDYEVAVIYVYDYSDIDKIKKIPAKVKLLLIVNDNKLLKGIKEITNSYYLINNNWGCEDIRKLRNNIIKSIDDFYGIK